MMQTRQAPLRGCACGCGARLRSWNEVAWARGHTPGPTAYSFEGHDNLSLREYMRARNGRCPGCGGPYPDGTRCERCPQVEAREVSAYT